MNNFNYTNSNYKIIILIIIVLIVLLILNNKKETFSNDTHPLNKYFNSVNVITVPKRKEYMTKLMNKENINANIIDATLVKDIDYNKLLMDNFVSPRYYSSKNKGRIACHLSQIKLIKEFLKSDDDTIFIFEDDINDNIKKNYRNIIEDSMKNIPDDWDIVFIGRCLDNCKKMKKIHNNLYKVYNPKCRHAYGLSRKGAEKILKYTIPMINNGDEMYAKNISNGNIKAYAIHPSIFFQNRYEFGSNLGNDKLFERLLYKINNFFIKSLQVEYPSTCV